MKYWTMNELSQLTRSALLLLQRSISAQLISLSAETIERHMALEILANIRVALGQPLLALRRGGLKPPSP
jgi:hypothetical protein